MITVEQATRIRDAASELAAALSDTGASFDLRLDHMQYLGGDRLYVVHVDLVTPIQRLTDGRVT